MPTPHPTATPPPTETPLDELSIWELMRRVNIGEITDEEAVDVLRNRKSAKPGLTHTASGTAVPVGPGRSLSATPPGPSLLSPSQRHLEEKKYMLELINGARNTEGLGPVELGDNAAAQVHAESSLANCFSSHWGLDGLKPYMRYSLAGGYQSNGENGHGLDYCLRASDGYSTIGNIYTQMRKAMDGWLGSPGHRKNILDPVHRKVNIGLAWDRYNVQMYQHFEGDYVGYSSMPKIDNGLLSFSGRVKNGAVLGSPRDFQVQIYYDPPPSPLTPGQVARTYCYDHGRNVASLREKLTGGRHWTTHSYSLPYQKCPDPAEVPPDAAPPKSHDDAFRMWREAVELSRSTPSRNITAPWIDAEPLSVNGDSFSVNANIRDLLDKHGEGVYSVMIWGRIEGVKATISHYSIFYKP